MSTTDKGWSKEFPTTDGDYLCRINEHDLSPVSFRLENGAIYEYGCGKNLRSDYYHHANGYEFLGPFTWKDFEQLAALRKAAADAEKFLAWFVESGTSNLPKGVKGSTVVLAALRKALGDK